MKYNSYTGMLNLNSAIPGGSGSLTAGVMNLGITLSSGVFSITGYNGTSISNTNPAYIFMPSSTAGESQQFQITSNQSFEDANGTSYIIGNLFGLTTGVAETNDVPFFIYAVSDSTDSTISFGISRTPNLKISASSSSNLGSPSSATADIQQSIFFFNSVTLANYTSRPCKCIGSFRMTKDSSDDWTISSLSTTDGIGNFQKGIVFTCDTGQYGNASGAYFADNSGSAPTFTTDTYEYVIDINGKCQINFFGSSCNSAGTGSNILSSFLPFYTINNYVNGASFCYQSGYKSGICNIGLSYTTQEVSLLIDSVNSTSFILNSDIASSSWFGFSINYTIKNTV